MVAGDQDINIRWLESNKPVKPRNTFMSDTINDLDYDLRQSSFIFLSA